MLPAFSRFFCVLGDGSCGGRRVDHVLKTRHPRAEVAVSADGADRGRPRRAFTAAALLGALLMVAACTQGSPPPIPLEQAQQ